MADIFTDPRVESLFVEMEGACMEAAADEFDAVTDEQVTWFYREVKALGYSHSEVKAWGKRSKAEWDRTVEAVDAIRSVRVPD